MIVWIPCSGYAFSSIHIQRTNQWGGLAGSAPEYAERSIVVQNENLGVGGVGGSKGDLKFVLLIKLCELILYNS